MWYTFLATGMRLNELVSLTWDDVDLDRGEIVIRSEVSKNSELATIPLRHELWQVLSGMYDRRKGKHVFTNSKGTPWRHNLQKRFNEILEKAGIAKRSSAGMADIHSLRVTYGTDLVEAGVDIRTVQRLMRHKSATVTMQFYARVRQANLRPAVESVPLRLVQEPATHKSGNKVETLEGVFQAASGQEVLS